MLENLRLQKHRYKLLLCRWLTVHGHHMEKLQSLWSAPCANSTNFWHSKWRQIFAGPLFHRLTVMEARSLPTWKQVKKRAHHTNSPDIVKAYGVKMKLCMPELAFVKLSSLSPLANSVRNVGTTTTVLLSLFSRKFISIISCIKAAKLHLSKPHTPQTERKRHLFVDSSDVTVRPIMLVHHVIMSCERISSL